MIGVVQISKLFDAFMEKNDLQRIESIGKPFDPELHQAISTEASDQETDTVLREVCSAYKLGNKVVQVAKVILSE